MPLDTADTILLVDVRTVCITATPLFDFGTLELLNRRRKRVAVLRTAEFIHLAEFHNLCIMDALIDVGSDSWDP